MLLWVKLGILLALAGALWYGKHSYDEGKREEGREEIRVAVAKETLRKTEAWTRKAEENEASAKAATGKRVTAFASIHHDLTTVPAGDYSAFERVFNRARDAAESARAAPLPPESAPAPASSNEALIVQLYDWAGIAISKDEQWRSYYNSLRSVK